MCQVNQREITFMRDINGQAMVIPNSLCVPCSNSNSHYHINEEEVPLLEVFNDTNEKIQLLKKAQTKQESAISAKYLENGDLDVVNNNIEDLIENEFNEELRLLQNEAIKFQNLIKDENEIESEKNNAFNHNDLTDFNPYKNIITGSTVSQINALMVKNLRLQYRQKWSNCCSIFFVCFMFLMLYILSLLYISAAEIKQCPEGYLTDIGCSSSTLIEHIFSGSSSSMITGQKNDYGDDFSYNNDDTLGSSGYTIENYLIPTGSSSYIYLFDDLPQNDDFFNTNVIFQLPDYNYRTPYVWSNLFESTTLNNYYSDRNLYISYRAPPVGMNASNNAGNEYLYSNQQYIYEGTLNTAYPKCDAYSPESLIGSTVTPSYSLWFQQNFSDMFTDAMLICPDCNENGNNNDGDIYFNGSLWTTVVALQYNNDNVILNYLYGYLDVISSQLDETQNYLGKKCPDGIAQFSISINQNGNLYYSKNGNNNIAMTYLNFLSNLLIQADLETYDIQAGYSTYGVLSFQAQRIASRFATIWIIIAMLLVNGFWPIAVWRLSYERSQEIVLMIKTVGMRSKSYILGMFLFDNLVQIVTGSLMIIMSTELNIKSFSEAPIGGLILTICLSSFALNSMSLVMVRILNKYSSILPLMAPCLCIVSTVAITLINILVYPNDGDWPWYMSIYPFFAQGRALYILLVFQVVSSDVIEIFVTFFLFGLFCLFTTYLMEMEQPFNIITGFVKDKLNLKEAISKDEIFLHLQDIKRVADDISTLSNLV